MKRKTRKKITDWEKNGQPIPPPHIIKQQTLLTHAQNFGIRILVETGTYHGEMVKAMKDDFDLIYSIELSYELFLKAIKRFEGEEHIHLIHGDSGVKIKDIIT